MPEFNTVVLIKQVPDMDEVEFDEEEGRIDRGSAGVETNPFCLNALEVAVRFREKIGGNVIAISMGPPSAEATLRDALARGADQAILLSDKVFGGADTRATAFTLSTAIKKLESFNLIICGEKTVDGDTGQVGPEVAEILDIPHIAYVSEVVERSNNELVVKSETFGGTFLKRLRMPGLITVTKDVNEPKIPTFKSKMRARDIEIKKWVADDFSDVADLDKFGIKGSHTLVKNITIPPKVERKGHIFKEEPSKSAESLVSKLKEKEFLG